MSVLPVVCTDRGQHRKFRISRIAMSGTTTTITGTASADKPPRPDDLTGYTFTCPVCGRHVQLRAENVREFLVGRALDRYVDISCLGC
ncbi:hypothetical protein ABZT23_08220 [Streptomyces sp. NPDC005386]|uniref:hypothetical protein n=1 Tax=Streptomyces sp. NPDC005386 TaxID=3154562 RepID=UPI0033BD5413